MRRKASCVFLVLLVVTLVFSSMNFEALIVKASPLGDNQFGYDGTGATTTSIEDYIRGSWFTCPEWGTAKNITAKIYRVLGSPKVKCAIYKKSDNSLVGYTEEKTITSTGWYTFSFSGGGGEPALQPIDYYLVAWGDSNFVAFYCTSESGKGVYDSETYGSFPDTWNPTSEDYKYCIYCTYEDKENCFGFMGQGSDGSELINNDIHGSWFTTPCALTVKNITVHIDHTESGSKDVKCAIYKKSDDSLISYTGAKSISSDGWYTFNFSSGGGEEEITGSTDVYLVAWADGATVPYLYIKYDTLTNKGAEDLSTSFPIDPWNPTQNNHKYSIFCCYEEGVSDDENPLYYDVLINSTASDNPCLFSVNWTDNIGLDTAIFSWNGTGSWQNETTSLSGTTDWGNFTKDLPTTIGTLVQWKMYANDTNGNLNDTMPTQSLTVTDERFLYPSIFDETEDGWGKSGVSPYLHDDTSAIQNIYYSNISWFHFHDPILTPQQIYLELYGSSTSADNDVEIYIHDGTSSNDVGTVNLGYHYACYELNLTSILDTQQKLKNAKLRIESKSGTLNKNIIKKARLRMYVGAHPSNIGATSSNAESSSTLYCEWFDADGLSVGIVSHNNTGSWQNETVDLSGTTGWSNKTLTLNASSLNMVAYCFYANDTNDNWEETDIQYMKLTVNYNPTKLHSFDSGELALLHSLGRKSFWGVNSQRYWIFWFDGTYGESGNQVYSSSTNGSEWNNSTSFRSAIGGGGRFYAYYENRDEHDYVHYQYGSEETSEHLYYRRGDCLSNGTIVWSATEQTVVECPTNWTLCPAGLAITPSGFVFVGYIWKNASGWGNYKNLCFNVTFSNKTDGMWETYAGYPKLVNVTDIPSACPEGTLWSVGEDNDCYVVVGIGGYFEGGSWYEESFPVQGVMIDDHVMQNSEDISNKFIIEARSYTALSVYGDIHIAYISNESSQTMYYCWRNHSSGQWDIQDEVVTTYLTEHTGIAGGWAGLGYSYPIIGFDKITNVTFINWWTKGDESAWLKYRSSGTWQTRKRILVSPSTCGIHVDPNILIARAHQHDIFFAFATKGLEFEIWTYIYSISEHFKKAVSQQITFVLDNAYLAEAFGSVSQAIEVALSSSTLFDILKDVSQTINFGSSVAYLAEVFGSVSQSVSFSSIGNRLIEIVDSVSQAIPIDVAGTYLAEAFGSVSQSLNFALDTTRLQTLLKGVSQQLTLSLTGNRLLEMFRSVSQTLSFSSVGNRLIDISKAASQTISVALNGEYLAEMFANVAQLIGLALSVIPTFFKIASQAITFLSNATYLKHIYKTIVQTLTFALFGSPYAGAFRQAYQTLSFGVGGDRLLDVLKDVSQAVSLASNGERLIEVTYQATQSITMSLTAWGGFILERVGSLALSLSMSASMLSHFMRNAIQTINAQILVLRTMEFFRGVTQSIGVALESMIEMVGLYYGTGDITITVAISVSTLKDLLRAASQSISIALATSTLAEFVRTASQGLTLSLQSGWNVFKIASQNISIGLSAIANTLCYGLASLTVSFSMVASLAGEYVRSATQTVSLALSGELAAGQFYERVSSLVIGVSVAIISVASEFVRSATQTLATSFSITRLIDVTFQATQTIAITLSGIGYTAFKGAGSLALTFATNVTSALAYFIRTATQTITTTVSVDRLIEITKTASQVLLVLMGYGFYEVPSLAITIGYSVVGVISAYGMRAFYIAVAFAVLLISLPILAVLRRR